MELARKNHIIMKNNIWKYIRSRPGMPAVVKCVAYKSKANVTADYENIKYYFRAPSHWVQEYFEVIDPRTVGSPSLKS